MATTSRGSKGRSTTKRPTVRGKATVARAKAPSVRARKPANAAASAQKAAAGYANGVLKSVRQRPLTAAVLAAGAAGAAAFLWAKRALIGEQASVARSKVRDKAVVARGKIGDLREQAGEQAAVLREEAGEKAKAFRGKLNERFFAVEEAIDLDPVREIDAQGARRAPKKSQSDIAAEALSLKQLGDSDPLLDEQSKVGAVAY